jgi:hypothetical protein
LIAAGWTGACRPVVWSVHSERTSERGFQLVRGGFLSGLNEWSKLVALWLSVFSSRIACVCVGWVVTGLASSPQPINLR